MNRSSHKSHFQTNQLSVGNLNAVNSCDQPKPVWKSAWGNLSTSHPHFLVKPLKSESDRAPKHTCSQSAVRAICTDAMMGYERELSAQDRH